MATKLNQLVDCFTINELSGVVPLQWSTLGDKPYGLYTKIIITKKINISPESNPMVIIIGFDPNEIADENVVKRFTSNEKSIVSSFIDIHMIHCNIAEHELHLNP